MLPEEAALDPDELGDQLELVCIEHRVRLGGVGDQRAVDGRSQTVDLVGDLDDHPAAILGVADPAYEASSLEPVEHARDRPGRESNRVRELPSGHRSARTKDVEAPPVGPVQACQVGDGRVEEFLVSLPSAHPLAVVGLGWMLFRWSPPSRLVGLVYLVVGSALVGAWPIAVAFHAEIPGFAQLNLYLALGMGGPLLTLIAPFLFALGLVRLVLPLPMGWWPTRTSGTVGDDSPAVSSPTGPSQPA